MAGVLLRVKEFTELQFGCSSFLCPLNDLGTDGAKFESRRKYLSILKRPTLNIVGPSCAGFCRVTILKQVLSLACKILGFRMTYLFL